MFKLVCMNCNNAIEIASREDLVYSDHPHYNNQADVINFCLNSEYDAYWMKCKGCGNIVGEEDKDDD